MVTLSYAISLAADYTRMNENEVAKWSPYIYVL